MIFVPSRYIDSYANYLIGAGVPKDKVDDCMLWAFGPKWRTNDLGAHKDYWNKKHNLPLKITNDMPIGQTLFKIGILYCILELKIKEV